MWGRELRAGLAFVLVSLLAGAGVRGWRRDHEARFQDLVETLVEQDQAAMDRIVAPAPPGPERDAVGGPDKGGVTAQGASRRPLAAVGDPLRPGSLDVDRASVPEWIRLPGIGPSLAARIVADREARGPFVAPEGLLRVPGIGPKTLQKIRPFLTAEGRGAPAPNSGGSADSAATRPR